VTAQRLLTREQVRAVDRVAIEQYGIPGVVLMENAGRACARAAAEMMGDAADAGAVVLCGRGNNGGDGFVIARHLSNGGARVRIVLLGSAEDVLGGGGDAAVNLRIALNMALPLREAPSGSEAAEAIRSLAGADLIVDAMLGTGARGEVREPVRSAIEALNDCGRPVLAVDVPSGLDCDTGRPMGLAVRAARTVTFVAAKVGFAQPGAEDYTGVIEVAEIGLPRAVLDEATERLEPRRARRTDKKESDVLSNRVIGCALEVHRALGPGLLESAYRQCLAHELALAGIPFQQESALPVEYKGVQLDCAYRLDLLVDDKLVVEVKSLAALTDIHMAQVLTYMRMLNAKVGLLLNFNVSLLKDGVKRVVL